MFDLAKLCVQLYCIFSI